jgi:PAS domain S-box-containing protein
MTSTPLPLGSGSPPEVIEQCLASAIEHFMNAASEAFALIDQDGRVVRANIAYRRLTGPAGGAHDASILSYIDTDKREAAREALRSLNDKAPIRTMQMRFRIGGEMRLIDAEISWLSDAGLISFVGRDVTRQDVLERERQETATARDAVEQVGDIGHWRAGRDFKLNCSAGASRILGLDPAAPPLVLTDLVEMILPEDREAVVQAAREAFEKRKPVKQTFRLRRADGTTRMIRVAGAPSIDARGQVEAMHGVVVDKSDGHAALQAALSADSTVRRFVQAAPMSICMCDNELRVMMASASWIAEHGLTEGEVLGRNIYEIQSWVPEKWRLMHRRVLRGESMSHESDPYDSPGGGQRWLKWSAAPWYDGNGNIGGIIAVHEDVTAIVKAQHEVESSKERMSFGMAITQMMIWELDFEMRETYIEGDWKHFFPQRPTFDSLTGSDSWIHPSEREMLANKWRAHLAGGAPYTAEYRVMFADGREIWHAASIRILKTVKGSPARAFAVIQDITARKHIELKAMEAEQRALVAAAAKSDFLSNMSHEIRTPLNGVLAVSEVLARTELDERQGEMVRLISTSGKTLLRVMDDLVEFSRLEGDDISFDVRPFELEEALRNTCEAARTRAEAKGLRFDSFISASCDGVYRADPVRIGQVLGNLLNNAVKFTDQGHITVSAGVEELPEGKTQLRLTVTDTGVGFAPELAERIFERFEQADISTSRRYGGLGLGLSIVKRLVELMSGQVSATSKQGEGSTFEALIPISRDRIAALGALTAVAVEDFDTETSIENLRLLVAEDNPMNRRVVELLLAQSGLHITFAENGKEAVEKFSIGKFDLVLMDLQMPIMGGLAAMRAIREFERSTGRIATPMLAVSANATDDHVQEAKEAGADDHVAKPIVRETLFEAIARYAKPSGQASSVGMDDDFDLDDLDIAV